MERHPEGALQRPQRHRFAHLMRQHCVGPDPPCQPPPHDQAFSPISPVKSVFYRFSPELYNYRKPTDDCQNH